MRSIDPVKRARAQEAAANMPPQDKRLPRPKQYDRFFAEAVEVRRRSPAICKTFTSACSSGVRKTWRWKRWHCASCGSAWR